MLGRPRALPIASLALLFAACGGNTASTADSGHSTPTSDAGNPPVDSGAHDTGTHDTGDNAHDTGTTDAVVTHDTGTPDTSVAPGDAATDASDGGTVSVPLPPFAAGAPLTGSPETWTWIPIDGAECGNGSATGIGVNLSSTAGARVLVYLEGGGACWNDLTCNTLMTASNLSGYGESDFTAETTDTSYLALAGGFFDRTATANPFADYSYVYIPYCTGDVHAGNNVASFASGETHFVGAANFGLYLDRIVPTFSTTDRVVLAGSSAGGFGAAVNWWRTQAAFGSIRVDLLDDSGTAMPASIQADGYPISTYSVPWNLGPSLPPGCAACATDLSQIYSNYDTAFGTTHRGALLSYTQDTVLPTFFGITTAEFTTGLSDDTTSYFTASDPLKAFTINDMGHVLFFSPQLATSTSFTVQQFVTAMVTDDTTWTNEGP